MPPKRTLSKYSKQQIKKAAKIKAIFFEADGVLTDGKISYNEAGKEIKNFNVKDCNIISHLKKAGIVVGIISARESPAVSKLAVELKLDFCHQGIVDKLTTFEKLVAFYQLKNKSVAYIGYDIGDLGTLNASGLSACPADAMSYIRNRVEIVTAAKGGEGSMRQVADLVLAAKGVLNKS